MLQKIKEGISIKHLSCLKGGGCSVEQLSSKDHRSIEPCDNFPVTNNLPPATGTDSERNRYEEDTSNQDKQHDHKVRLICFLFFCVLFLLLLFNYLNNKIIY